MQFETYTPPAVDSSEYDSYKPSEHVGALLIVKVTGFSPQVSTSQSPEPKDVVNVDVYDLDDATGKHLYRNVSWWNGALVDGLKQYVGRSPLVIRIAWATAQKSGRQYLSIEPAGAQDIARAQQHVNANGDPFAPVLTTPAPAAAAAAPFSAGAAAAAPPF